LGHGADVDAEQSWSEVSRVGDAAADRVGQTHLVADDPAKPVAEAWSAAKDVVKHGKGGVIRVIARDAQVAEHNVDLLSGMGDAPDPRPRQPGGPGAGNPRRAEWLPGLEMRSDQAPEPTRLEIAGGDEEGVLRSEVPLVVRPDVLESQPVNVADRTP